MSKLFTWTLWLLLIPTLLSSVGLLVALGFASPTSTIFGLIAGSVFILIVVFLLKWAGFLRTGSARWFITAIAWGASFPVMAAVPLGTAWSTIMNALEWKIVEVSFAGAYPEELAKILGVFLILVVFRRICFPWQGMIVGMGVGLGFEVYENILYGTEGGAMDANSDLHGVVAMWATRILLGPGLHLIFTGLAGLGIGYALFTARKTRTWRFGIAAAGIGAGFLAHFLWNMSLDGTAAQVVWIIVLAIIIYGGAGYLFYLQVKVAKRYSIVPRSMVSRPQM